MTTLDQRMREFLHPLQLPVERVLELSHLFESNFAQLAAESPIQFLPTPITESLLRPAAQYDESLQLAIDIGGTNLRVGFVQVQARNPANSSPDVLPQQRGHSGKQLKHAQVRLEQSWPIDDHLKNDNPESLFRWIGACIAQVVQDGCRQLGLPRDRPLSLGVSFSFPMIQDSLSQATIMGMGKGFAITSKTDIGSRLVEAYDHRRGQDLPDLQVAALANDAVSTLLSFIFKYNESPRRKASMGLILGTGCNATIPLPLSLLHPSKRPSSISRLPEEEKQDDVRIAINTEWSISGTAVPLRQLDLITKWDQELDAEHEIPGYQPLEYMTAGRYLGELGRIIFIDCLVRIFGEAEDTLPDKLLHRHGMSTTFLSTFKPPDVSPLSSSSTSAAETSLLSRLQTEYPQDSSSSSCLWTQDHAVALHLIAKAIQIRAAGIVSAAIVGLMSLAKDIPAASGRTGADKESNCGSHQSELGVGYTGGCIVHFQDYLADCQHLLDTLMRVRFNSKDPPVRLVLSPCHDGGLTGAGILAAAAAAASIGGGVQSPG